MDEDQALFKQLSLTSDFKKWSSTALLKTFNNWPIILNNDIDSI